MTVSTSFNLCKSVIITDDTMNINITIPMRGSVITNTNNSIHPNLTQYTV